MYFVFFLLEVTFIVLLVLVGWIIRPRSFRYVISDNLIKISTDKGYLSFLRKISLESIKDIRLYNPSTDNFFWNGPSYPLGDYATFHPIKDKSRIVVIVLKRKMWFVAYPGMFSMQKIFITPDNPSDFIRQVKEKIDYLSNV